MKKQLICVMAAAAMLAAAPAALAANVSYNPGTANSVEVTDATNKKTVLITADGGAIVYVDQASDVFSATEEFKLKSDAADGKYTVKLGSDTGDVETKDFYIGMTNSATDKELKKPETGATVTNADNTVNIGYRADNITGTYNKLIVKKSDGNYYGMDVNTLLTLHGGSVGIQFNHVSSEAEIEGVWLTSRDYE